MPEVVLATFNVHGGVDGWGRRFDVLAACRALDADVLVLQETFWPDAGGGEAEGLADLGYRLFRAPLGHGRRFGADPRATARWGPHGIGPFSANPLTLREPRRLPAGREGERGTVEVVVASRLEVLDHHVVDLLALPRDASRRRAVVVRLGDAAGGLTVVGTHLAHLSHGSPLQIRALSRSCRSDAPLAVAGDMNAWGPVLSALCRGYTRAVGGPTWPCWGPHSQIDHVLVRGGVVVSEVMVPRLGASDHLPLRVRLRVG